MSENTQLMVPVNVANMQSHVVSALEAMKETKELVLSNFVTALNEENGPLRSDPELLLKTVELVSRNEINLIEAQRKYLDSVVKAHKVLNGGTTSESPTPKSNDIPDKPAAAGEEGSGAFEL